MTHYELQTVRPATRRVCTIIGCVIFAAGAAWELTRVVLNRPWAGVAGWLSDAVSVTFASLWLIAAALIWRQLRRPQLHFPALLFGIGGTFIMLAHGAVTRVLGSPFGPLYWLLAAVQVVVLRKSLLRAAVPHRVSAPA
jgi:hypothetical protein